MDRLYSNLIPDNRMKIESNIIIDGPHRRPIPVDIFYTANRKPKPLIIFSHGFKGFKDWGHFNLIARKFARNDFVFVKFNFSHNGTTPADPGRFVDLEAFGNNSFSIELDDLGAVLDFVTHPDFPVPAGELNLARIYLLGHSRGGGITILRAREDVRVKKIATWASVNEYGKYWSGDLVRQWEDDGVIYVQNTRTGQQLPLYWQLYQNYLENQERLSIPAAVRALKIPFLIVHGTADSTVPYQAALEMREWNPAARLVTIVDGDHTFGGRHPWEADDLPADTQKAVQETIGFFRETPSSE